MDPDRNLTTYLVNLARYLLEQYGEFYPFAAELDFQDTVVPVILEVNDDHPSSVDVVSALENTILTDLQNGVCKAGGICCDVRVLHPVLKQQTDAIQIKIKSGEASNTDLHIPYLREQGSYRFLDAYYDEQGC